MLKFNFTSEQRTVGTKNAFNGSVFYNVYKDANFLRVDANVESILAHGYLMRQKLKSLPPGQSLVVDGMELERNTPLIIKKAGNGVIVEDFEFTYNRLAGLVAAYAYENRNRFPAIESSEAKALGLSWNCENEEKCKLYLSAVSGTENMIDQFSFFPLLCGLRKFQLKKIPVNLVVGMGYVKNNEGVTMAKLLKQHLVMTKRIWLMFPGTALRDMQTLIDDTPEFKKVFID